jgi:alanine-glyoxylate transaminase/serine-glyoxylate transaminase/serine-pyruvate transaminase
MSAPASLSAGRELLAIPGPSTLPDVVAQAMARPSADIYSAELEGVTDSLIRDLAAVARTRGPAFVHVANGHGGWEAALANTLSSGDRVLVLESGRFAVGWGEMAEAMGVAVEILNAPPGRAVDPEAVERRLRADAAGAIRAVLVVQVDTASSVKNDVAAIRRAIDLAGHSALYMVDVIASLGCMPFEMDAWGVDVAVGGSQKGLMAPPGLAFCWAGPRAMEAHARAGLRTRYWDWTLRLERPHYRKYCGTPPTHLLFAQRAALDLLLAEGLERAWARHAALAGAARAAVEAWSAAGALGFAATAPAERADSVTTVLTPGLDADAFRAFCRERLGLVLGVGLGPYEGRAFRIGHMGWLNAPMMMGALGAAEAGLRAQGARLGPGALDAAAAAIAAHFAAPGAQGGGAVPA